MDHQKKYIQIYEENKTFIHWFLSKKCKLPDCEVQILMQQLWTAMVKEKDLLIADKTWKKKWLLTKVHELEHVLVDLERRV